MTTWSKRVSALSLVACSALACAALACARSQQTASVSSAAETSPDEVHASSAVVTPLKGVGVAYGTTPESVTTAVTPVTPLNPVVSVNPAEPVNRGAPVAVTTAVVVPTTAPSAEAAGATSDVIGHGKRVLVISIDGCRPDVALRANMPNLRSIISTGAFSMYARTTDVAITLPSHTSMVTGVTPDRHNVTWNDDADEKTFHYPAYPTLMELAHNAGYSTAIVAAKSKFVALAKPGTIDWGNIPPAGKTTKADVTAENARAIIEAHKPQVMMLHFGDPDGAGHAIGWGTPDQVTALESVDKGLGVVFTAMKTVGTFDDTLIIISADHGGFGRTHGANDLRAAFIPWISHGPHVKVGYDLTRIKEVAIRTEDTFATACDFLGLTPADDIDGKPVNQIYQREELMSDTPAPKAKAPKAPAAQVAK